MIRNIMTRHADPKNPGLLFRQRQCIFIAFDLREPMFLGGHIRSIPNGVHLHKTRKL